MADKPDAHGFCWSGLKSPYAHPSATMLQSTEQCSLLSNIQRRIFHRQGHRDSSEHSTAQLSLIHHFAYPTTMHVQAPRRAIVLLTLHSRLGAGVSSTHFGNERRALAPAVLSPHVFRYACSRLQFPTDGLVLPSCFFRGCNQRSNQR